jgi:hypothetical protein
MLKKIFKIIGVFILGVFGGIFADQILWPYFIERPLFYQYRLEQPPIFLTEKKEITIQENVAITDAIEKVEKVIVGVSTKTKTGETLEGSGLILTADGLAVTLAELVPKSSTSSIFVDGKLASFQILKRDLKLKIIDFGTDTKLDEKIRGYYELLSDYMNKRSFKGVIHTIHMFRPFYMGED